MHETESSSSNSTSRNVFERKQTLIILTFSFHCLFEIRSILTKINIKKSLSESVISFSPNSIYKLSQNLELSGTYRIPIISYYM